MEEEKLALLGGIIVGALFTAVAGGQLAVAFGENRERSRELETASNIGVRFELKDLPRNYVVDASKASRDEGILKKEDVSRACLESVDAWFANKERVTRIDIPVHRTRRGLDKALS